MDQAKIEYEIARVGRLNRWVAACGGTETPFTTRTGHKVLYCHNFALSQHAYIDCGSDLLIPDENLPAYGLGVS